LKCDSRRLYDRESEGVTNDKEKHCFFDDADELIGREKEFVDALMATPKEIQQAYEDGN
jgi:hypothetical protein